MAKNDKILKNTSPIIKNRPSGPFYFLDPQEEHLFNFLNQHIIICRRDFRLILLPRPKGGTSIQLSKPTYHNMQKGPSGPFYFLDPQEEHLFNFLNQHIITCRRAFRPILLPRPTGGTSIQLSKPTSHNMQKGLQADSTS
ncbi:hypothetical protein CHS0354_017734 [Potamilus streckersoni]|uniref:Uncharacterized protein n=1 Tax=Potamilus streckersoni TaxID=2493646 RepID=A0AAE0SI57_9BIVA|nr:hypothetical protein CHS0354_017734 [Potamilus streckersoni]